MPGEREETAAREAGIRAFVPKPITGSLLLDAIIGATGVATRDHDGAGRQRQ
jgi:hypothetical protein